MENNFINNKAAVGVISPPRESPKSIPVYRPVPPDYKHEIYLKDGSKAIIRPITCDDKQSLLKFHSRLSEDTRFLRYHYLKGDLTEEDLKTFCEIDYKTSMALVVEGERDGDVRILGVGRYFQIPPDHTAEVAMVVEDAEQCKGIGTQLLRHLAVLALREGIHDFVGEVLRQNRKMLNVFNKYDPRMGYDVDSPTTCNVNVSLHDVVKV
jgi:RimJ/RimL family protein N-acetyltransferase